MFGEATFNFLERPAGSSMAKVRENWISSKIDSEKERILFSGDKEEDEDENFQTKLVTALSQVDCRGCWLVSSRLLKFN